MHKKRNPAEEFFDEIKKRYIYVKIRILRNNSCVNHTCLYFTTFLSLLNLNWLSYTSSITRINPAWDQNILSLSHSITLTKKRTNFFRACQ